MTCELKPGATKMSEEKGVERMTWCGEWHTDTGASTSPIYVSGEPPVDCAKCIKAKAEA